MIECKNIIITHTDRQRLGTLIEKAEISGIADRKLLDDLQLELERAHAVESQDVPPDVVTMNSKVRLRDLETNELVDYTLVYPRDADPAEDRVSVLAPIGTAIIGCRKGDVIEWPVPAGIVRLAIEEVLHQTESVGEFDR